MKFPETPLVASTAIIDIVMQRVLHSGILYLLKELLIVQMLICRSGNTKLSQTQEKSGQVLKVVPKRIVNLSKEFNNFYFKELD